MSGVLDGYGSGNGNGSGWGGGRFNEQEYFAKKRQSYWTCCGVGMTHGEIIRHGGAVPLRNGHFIWSEDAFHRAFKVGDIISGYGSRVTGKITAIGDRRFLYRITRANRKDERVGTIRSMTGWGTS